MIALGLECARPGGADDGLELSDDAQDPGPPGRCLHARTLHGQPDRRGAQCRRAHRRADAGRRARAEQRRDRVHARARRRRPHRARALLHPAQRGRLRRARHRGGAVRAVAPARCAAAGNVRSPRRASSTSGARQRPRTARIAIRRSPPPLGRELNDRERLAVLDALALASESLDTRMPLRIAGASSTRLLDRRARRRSRSST